MLGNSGSPRALVVAAVVAFAAFGAFWGAWGASIPRVRHQAGLDDSQLGMALLFVGAGALPAMLLTGKAIDRWGLRVAALTIAALGASGAILPVASQDLVSLSAALTLVGVTSGASDVAINTVAGRAERNAGRPVITRVHAVFSTFVVIASLVTGLLAGIGAPVITVFALVAITALVAAVLMIRALPRGGAAGTETSSTIGQDTAEQQSSAGSGHATRPRTLPKLSLIGFGLLGALAFASENAHQSWGAIFITDALGTDVALGSLAPAVFAAAVAVTRFAAGGIGVAHARSLLVAGSATAAAGAVLVSTAANLTLSLIGLITAAAGTAVLFPTVLGVVSARVDETHRGRSTSTVTTVAYLGFLLGPVYVGFWSGAVGIRGAMLAVAALALLLLILTPMVKPTTVVQESMPPEPGFHGDATDNGRRSTDRRPSGGHPDGALR
jgi:MFS family permease